MPLRWGRFGSRGGQFHPLRLAGQPRQSNLNKLSGVTASAGLKVFSRPIWLGQQKV
jgi:hypothetical protein